MTSVATGRVAPFGHPGITARLQLPQAYRSLPRPSSPLDAKASTVCLIAFDLKFVVVPLDRKSTRLNSSHVEISYAVFCLKKKSTSRYYTIDVCERNHCLTYGFLIGHLSS